MYYSYGLKEMDYLKSKDRRLAEAIEQIGHIERSVNPDFFSALVEHIIGQQISIAAQQTVCERLRIMTGSITPQAILSLSDTELQSIGITYKKVDYIRQFAQQVVGGAFDIEAVGNMPDDQVIHTLCQLKGVGKWTAEMMLIFCLQRPDVISYGDLAILRGMRMLYHHRKIDKKRFNMYAQRFSPYATVASLYLWAIAGGAIPGMRDKSSEGIPR